MNETRVMMVLLDGAPFTVFSSLAKKGILPNFQKLMNEGCFNLLNSTIPSTSPVAIPSLLTGKNPGKHGIFGWGYIKNGTYKPPPSLKKFGALWDTIGAAQKKVILLNVPLTYPPFPVEGVLVSGPPTPRNRAYSYPPDIISRIESEIGRYYVDMNIEGTDFQGYDEETFIENAYHVTRSRSQATQYLMNNYEWTFFLTVFTTLDRVQHVFFGYFDEESPFFNVEKRKVLIDYYKEVDTLLGTLRLSMDENTILVVVSDHGFEYVSKLIGLSNILVEKGFIKQRSKFQPLTIENVKTFFKRIGFVDFQRKLSPRILQIANAILPRKTKYSESKCYSFGGTITINENNFNSLEEVEEFKKQLTDTLYSITDTNEDRIVDKVYDRTELYHGNKMLNSPHLIVRLKKGFEARTWTQTTFQPIHPMNNKTLKTGTHHSVFAQKGIFIAWGNGIKEGHHIEAEIVDIAPTILHILGIPMLPDTDGQVIKQIFEPESRFNLQPVKVQGHPRQLSYREKTKARVRKIRQHLNE